MRFITINRLTALDTKTSYMSKAQISHVMTPLKTRQKSMVLSSYLKTKQKNMVLFC